MKKIAIITKNTTFNKYFGGLEIHTKLLIDGLSNAGYEVHIYAPIRELKNNQISDGNKKYFFIDANYKTGPISVLFKKNWYLKSLEFFRSKNEEFKYDLVFSISSAGISVIDNKEDFDFKIVTVSHGSAYSEFQSIFNEGGFSFSFFKNLPYFLFNYLYKQRNFINKSDFVITVSNYVRESLIKETGIDQNRIFVIHNGVRVEEFTKNFEDRKKLRLIFAGRVEKSKGIFLLLESIKDLDVVLNVCGIGSALDSAKKLAKELRIEEKVNFLGKLDSVELNKRYKESDVLIAPSLRVEGFPMSIIEGMSYYLPVIASNIGGNSDAIFEGRNGFLIDVSDSEQLKDRIKFFDTYPEKVKQFGINSRNLAEQKFNLNIMIEEYLKVVNEYLRK